MTANDWLDRLRIETARRQLSELIGAQHQLCRAGRDSAAVELTIRDKRAELNDLINGQASISTALDRR